MELTVREQIVEVVNKLFVYTDNQDWRKLQEEVFTEYVLFDMSSLGGTNAKKSAKQICEEWKKGFEGIDAVYHLAGNHLVEVKHSSAEVLIYATATHYKKSANHGKTRDFVGSYNLRLVKERDTWKIDQLKYNLKYVVGNLELE